MKATWQTIMVAMLVAVVVLAVFAAMARAGGDAWPWGMGGMMRGVPAPGSEAGGCGFGGGQGGPAGSSPEITDPYAQAAVQELRREHMDEMRAWSDRYGEDPNSDEAERALRGLRQEHRDDMRELFDRFGIEWGGMMGGTGVCVGPDANASGCWGGPGGADPGPGGGPQGGPGMMGASGSW